MKIDKVLILGLLVGAGSAQATVRVPALVGDHMVLQRQQPLPIWGWAEPGEKVTVSLRGKAYATTTSASGKWQLTLPSMQAGGPFTLTVKGQNTLTFSDVLVGDVWLASGQSNMEMPLRDPNAPKPGAYPVVRNAEQEVAQANFPQIRQFTVKKAPAATPLAMLEGHRWEVCSPQTASSFAAVPFFFARNLYQQYQVPIGVICSTWGGTPAEAWVSAEKLRQLPDFWETTWPVALPAANPQNTPTVLFNSQIAPLIPYALKGVIWYQGESNVGRAAEYRRLFPPLIQDWRTRWGTELPFLFVQLANWMPALPDPTDSDWARLREAQTAALALPKTGMAVAIDVGDATDIHPANKQEVGRRLALAARQVAYADRQVVAAGPVFQSMRVKGNIAELSFGQVGAGLQVKESSLRGFAVAGADKQFHWATATLRGNIVVLSSAAVSAPVAVRYNWADNPAGNLYNQEGLPAAPFRTDTWEK